MSPQAMLDIKNLIVRFYTKNGVVKAVNGVSYSIDSGETLAVVGESGCGKTVHARSITRLIPIPPGKIENGKILFEGRDLLKISIAELKQIRGKKIAMVFQDPATFLNPVLTIGFQISEALRLHQNIKRRDARKKTEELLTIVGIPDAKQRADNFPHQFSGGMNQRAMIAMALSCNPRLLIADEPTTALDVTIQAQIIDLIKQLQKQFQMAVMWITHDLGVVAGLAHTINVMYAGYIVERGRVKDVYKRPRHPYTIGLLASLPRIDKKQGDALDAIPGNPPDLINLPRGCAFAERCPYVIEKCRIEVPPLEFIHTESHMVACWRWAQISGGTIVG